MRQTVLRNNIHQPFPSSSLIVVFFIILSHCNWCGNYLLAVSAFEAGAAAAVVVAAANKFTSSRVAVSAFAMSAAASSAMDNKGSYESNSDDSFRLAYVTDVEGNLDYFLRYVERSKVLRIDESSSSTSRGAAAVSASTIKSLVLDLVGESTVFVYGGDTVDKGPGDIRLVRALVALKKKYPDRVFLLVGNRDLK